LKEIANSIGNEKTIICETSEMELVSSFSNFQNNPTNIQSFNKMIFELGNIVNYYSPFASKSILKNGQKKELKFDEQQTTKITNISITSTPNFALSSPSPASQKQTEEQMKIPDGLLNIVELLRQGKSEQANEICKKLNSSQINSFREAAEKGLPQAQFILGRMYDIGLSFTRDYSEAMKWYVKASEQGYAPAQNNIGVMYSNGQGVTQNKTEALKWYLKAANQGHAAAQNNIGLLYDNGEGVAQSYTEAMRWLLKAADQGNASAQYNIGVMYAKGQGVTKNKEEAKRWFQKAANQGDEDAKKKLRQLS